LGASSLEEIFLKITEQDESIQDVLVKLRKTFNGGED